MNEHEMNPEMTDPEPTPATPESVPESAPEATPARAPKMTAEEKAAAKEQAKVEKAAEKERVKAQKAAEKAAAKEQAKADKANAALEGKVQKLRDTVHARLADLGEKPVPAGKLGKPGVKASPEEHQAFESLLRQFVAEEKLFEYPGEKFGTTKPIMLPWYEQAPHKSQFNKLAGIAKKMLDSDDTLSLDQIVAALRQQLSAAAIVPPVIIPTPSAARDTAPPLAPSPPPPPPPQPPAVDLPSVLKEAYEYLCLFAEYREKIVDLPRLYHESAKRMAGLTVPEFQDELLRMSQEWKIELIEAEETAEISEPDLAISHEGKLYNRIRWK